MKHFYIFAGLVLNLLALNAQNTPNGVTKIDETNYQAKFVFLDAANNLWVAPTGDHNAGLFHYNSGLQKTTDFDSGVFRGVAALGNDLYFASEHGLFLYRNGSFSQINNSLNLTGIVNYRDTIYTIDTSSALYQLDAGILNSTGLNNSNQKTFNTLKADANYLWIGASSGLLRFDGNQSRLFNLEHQPGLDASAMVMANHIKEVVIVPNGGLWAIGENNQQRVMRIKGDSLEYYDLSDALACEAKSMVPLNFNDLFFDANGNQVLSTNDYIAVLSQPAKLFIPDFSGFKHIPLVKEVIYFGDNSKVAAAPGGKLYFFNKNLYLIDPASYNDNNIRNQFAENIRYSSFQVNDLKANIANDGFVFNNNQPLDHLFGQSRLEAKGFNCTNLLASAGLWLSAIDQDSIYVSANIDRFKGSDFYPGPLDTTNGQFDSAQAAPYNRIWKVSSAEIEWFKLNYNNSSYTIPKDILEWPAHGSNHFTRNLAPFVDIDKNGKYEPRKGDYPKIKGDLMYWWVSNDQFRRSSSGAHSLGLEVHTSCYAFACNDFDLNDSEYVLNRSLFFDFRFINRSNKHYSQFYAGMYNQSGLGYPYDNYIGCDVEMNAGYLYNGDPNDDLYWNFGSNSPILFCKLLNQPLYSFSSFNGSNDPVSGYPQENTDYLNFMRGAWKNGMSFKYGGNGTNGSISTRYLFDNGTAQSGSLPAWHERNAGNNPGGRLFTVSTRMDNLSPNASQSFELAYIMVQKDDIDLFDNYNDYPRQCLRMVQSWYDKGNFPSCYAPNNALNAVAKAHMFRVYPNPGGEAIRISGNDPNATIRTIEILDLSGKTLVSQAYSEENNSEISVNLSGIGAGTYIIRVESDHGFSYLKFVKL